jgi:hypothetical protein
MNCFFSSGKNRRDSINPGSTIDPAIKFLEGDGATQDMIFETSQIVENTHLSSIRQRSDGPRLFLLYELLVVTRKLGLKSPARTMVKLSTAKMLSARAIRLPTRKMATVR